MSIIKITVPNPNDGTTTFDKIRFYEATDNAGTGASLLTTSSVDTSIRYQIDPGFTTYTYTSGATTKYYAAKYYNSSSGILSDYTTWVLGGKDRWDTMFENDMNDTSNAVWTASDIARYKTYALEALFPDLYRQVIDTSLTLDNDSVPTYTYTVPFGIFNISEVGIGDLQNVTSLFQIVHPDNWTFENSTLHFKSIPSSESSAVIRLIGHKKFLEVGEVPERFDRFVIFHMKMSAYLRLADDFPRFKTWSRLQEGTKVSFENLRVHAREFERKFVEGKAEVRDLLFPTLV
jgi:hypothetical protein